MAVNIVIEPFLTKRHCDDLVELHRGQGVAEDAIQLMLRLDALPSAGLIAYHVTSMAKIPVAGGFLRLVEGGYGQIDTLVTNAKLPGAIRHLGVSKLVDALIAHANKCKLHGIICLTSDAGILKRAESLGFHVLNQTPIALKL